MCNQELTQLKLAKNIIKNKFFQGYFLKFSILHNPLQHAEVT